MSCEHLFTLWKFRTANFTIEVDAFADPDVDLSFDDTGEVRQKLRTGELTAFRTEARVTRWDGLVIGEANLGGSIYENPREFRDHVGLAIKSRREGRLYGSYFKQMVSDAVDEARKHIESLSAHERAAIRLRAMAPSTVKL